ncbi:MAG: nucleoside-diphosphate kinase [Lysobacteraceae bacterium]|nr:MAG: nucleoside-diphosphate kinase [Xanthomonadaceae bacterium]
MPAWKQLTRIPLKARLYAREPYFREGLDQAWRCLGDATPETLHRSALMMIKPDGLIGGKAPRIVEFLHEYGFEIVAVRHFVLHRLQWRELWRYQLTAATLDRLMVNDLVFSEPGLMLCLRDTTVSPLPATVRLSELKGPSDVAQQTPGCLRRLMAQPNRVFSLFHVADEPADLLRELSIFLDAWDRARVFNALMGVGALPEDEQSRLDGVVEASRRSARSLDAGHALARVRAALGAQRGSIAETEWAALHAALQSMAEGERIAWRPFADALARSGLMADPWDIAILGASFIVYDDPEASKQLVAVGHAPWLQPDFEFPPED